jgi:hypothetical protein
MQCTGARQGPNALAHTPVTKQGKAHSQGTDQWQNRTKRHGKARPKVMARKGQRLCKSQRQVKALGNVRQIKAEGKASPKVKASTKANARATGMSQSKAI